MEYQKIINLLDSTPNQLSQFKTKNWIEINYQSRRMYNTNSDIRFKATILKSSLCDYSDAYILVKGRIIIKNLFKNCAPFINCKSEINDIEIDNAKDIDIVMRIYSLIEYSNNYSKTSRNLWQYYKDEPNGNLTDCKSFKSETKITGNTPADGNTKDVEIIVPLKYLSNFWRTLEMPLINCKINLILT